MAWFLLCSEQHAPSACFQDGTWAAFFIAFDIDMPHSSHAGLGVKLEGVGHEHIVIG